VALVALAALAIHELLQLVAHKHACLPSDEEQNNGAVALEARCHQDTGVHIGQQTDTSTVQLLRRNSHSSRNTNATFPTSSNFIIGDGSSDAESGRSNPPVYPTRL
jgi:hypothetical protein